MILAYRPVMPNTYLIYSSPYYYYYQIVLSFPLLFFHRCSIIIELGVYCILFLSYSCVYYSSSI